MSFDSILSRLERVRTHGDYASALCPFHPDRHPSLLVWPGGFRCYAASCGKRGTLRYLKAYLSGQSYAVEERPLTSAISWLGTYSETMANPHWIYAARRILGETKNGFALYLERRGLKECIEFAELGFWNGWYVVPIYDASRFLSGIVLRASPTVESNTGLRYITPRGQNSLLYMPNLSTESALDILVVFGIFDALSAWVLGIPAVTVTVGVAGIKAIMQLLQPLRSRLWLLPDYGEEDAVSFLARGLDWRSRPILDLAWPASCKDLNDLLVKGYGDWFRNQLIQRGFQC